MKQKKYQRLTSILENASKLRRQMKMIVPTIEWSAIQWGTHNCRKFNLNYSIQDENHDVMIGIG